MPKLKPCSAQKVSKLKTKPKWHGQKVHPTKMKWMVEVAGGTRVCHSCQANIHYGHAHLALYKDHGVHSNSGDYFTVPWRKNFCHKCVGGLIDVMDGKSKDFIAEHPEEYMKYNGIDPKSAEGKKIMGMHLRWKVENRGK